jgi:hypothetical protein
LYYLVVDRLEGSYAVLVAEWSGQEFPVPRGRFREGQVFRWTGRAWSRDTREERRRLAEARKRLEQLRRTDPGGDIQL